MKGRYLSICSAYTYKYRTDTCRCIDYRCADSLEAEVSYGFLRGHRAMATKADQHADFAPTLLDPATLTSSLQGRLHILETASNILPSGSWLI